MRIEWPSSNELAGGDTSRVELYLDGSADPVAMRVPPARFDLDTADLDDGPHELLVVATDRSGRRAVRRIPFEVRNGPGIAVNGLRSGDVVEGRLSLLVNAYGGAYEENWEPARAETPAPIPTWVWVLLLLIVAWSVFYTVRQWSPSGSFTGSPTYSGWQHHASARGPLELLLTGLAVGIVALVAALCFAYLRRPGESSPSHIKRRVLE